MSAKSPAWFSRVLRFLGEVLHSGLLLVGAMTTFAFFEKNWPQWYDRGLLILTVGLGIWLARGGIILPYLEGFKQAREASPASE
jgi:hypothetical protein